MSYTLISTVTLTSNQASISFNSIPATFDDLVIVMSGRSDGTANFLCGLQFNGASTNQSARILFGNGSSASSFSYTASGDYNIFGYMSDSGQTASTFGSISFYIPNYRSSVAKSVSTDSVNENNATLVRMAISAGLWNSTSAITSLTLVPVSSSTLAASGNFASASSASLYGITRGSSGGVVVS